MALLSKLAAASRPKEPASGIAAPTIPAVRISPGVAPGSAAASAAVNDPNASGIGTPTLCRAVPPAISGTVFAICTTPLSTGPCGGDAISALGPPRNRGRNGLPTVGTTSPCPMSSARAPVYSPAPFRTRPMAPPKSTALATDSPAPASLAIPNCRLLSFAAASISSPISAD